jgi:hypothetical protein
MGITIAYRGCLADPSRVERHPLLDRASDLMMDLQQAFRGAEPRFEAVRRTLFQGAGGTVGGLAQALSPRKHDHEDHGLRLVQLKCALRGAAFARGTLFPLRPAVPNDQWETLRRRLAELERDILQELTRVRSEYRPWET